MPTQIRLAKPEDAQAVADVYLASRATMTYLPQLHSEAVTRGFIRELVESKETWLAERNESVVGFAVIDGGWLEQLYVHPSRFNTGTGTRLFERVTREHPHGFQIWTFQSNAAARQFYEGHGCALVRLTDGHDNEEKLPDALYVWPAPT